MEIDFDRLTIHRIFDYDRRLLPNPYLAEVESHCHDIRSAVRTSGLSIGYPAWNMLYYTFLCAVPPGEPRVWVVETGTNVGFSTIVLAQVLKDRGLDSRVVTVDIDPAVVGMARLHVRRAGLEEFVEFHVDDSLRFLDRYVRTVERIDFAFLDGNHERDHVVEEFARVHPLLTGPASTVYFDNTSEGGVAEALRIIRQRFGGNLVELPNCSWAPPGNAIWQPEREAR